MLAMARIGRGRAKTRVIVWVWSALTRPIDIFRIGVFELA
jgi:hypothetical protein